MMNVFCYMLTAGMMSVFVVVAALGEMACPVFVGNVSYSLTLLFSYV